jgi:hypothetical protein
LKRSIAATSKRSRSSGFEHHERPLWSGAGAAMEAGALERRWRRRATMEEESNNGGGSDEE